MVKFCQHESVCSPPDEPAYNFGPLTPHNIRRRNLVQHLKSLDSMPMN